MITITLLTGPYAGQTRDVSAEDPAILLHDLWANHGWAWQIDYAAATPEEVIAWGRQDMASRCVRALKAGRKVFALGEVYEGFSQDIVGQLEDEIAESGLMVTVLSDDENGVVIGTGDFE